MIGIKLSFKYFFFVFFSVSINYYYFYYYFFVSESPQKPMLWHTIKYQTPGQCSEYNTVFISYLPF